MKYLKFVVYLPIGLIMYAFSKGFRDTVRRKMGSTINDTVEGGETVVAVLSSANGETNTIDVIGYPKRPWTLRLKKRIRRTLR